MNTKLTLSRRSVCLGITSATVLGSLNQVAQQVSATESKLADPVAAAAATKARALLDALDEKQKRRIQIEFDDDRRLTWHFVPLPARKGLELRAMTDEQIEKAIQLLSAVVSEYGFERSTQTMSYEHIILQHEGPARAEVRDVKKYNFAIFGEPSNEGSWGLSIEGHHISLNYTFVDGKVVDSTPQFFGVNPAKADKDYTVPSLVELGTEFVVKKGARLLGPEEDAGFAMLEALSEQQRSKAITSDQCPADILWGGVSQPKKIETIGIPASELTEAQMEQLWNLINALQCAMPASVIEERNKIIKDSDVSQVWFSWAGANVRDKQHYFRVHGPTFFAEYCNFQADSAGNTPNHIHCVWRDLTGDFNVELST